MYEYQVDRSFPWQGKVTEKIASVMKTFGVDLERLKERGVRHECSLSLKPGEICFITGASGAGKSVLLREMYNETEEKERLDINEIEIETGKSVIDCIEGDFFESLKVLSKAGLGDVFTAVNEPAKLSEGQQYRYRLAKALLSEKSIIFADEFCSNLDRISAAVIAHNIRRVAGTSGKTFVLASSHDDILADLRPEVVVVKRYNGTEIIRRGF
jgi:uncharacterized protein